MLLTFYKGVELPIWHKHTHFSLVTQPAAESPAASHSGSYALGVILAVLACLCYSTWIVLLVTHHSTHSILLILYIYIHIYTL